MPPFSFFDVVSECVGNFGSMAESESWGVESAFFCVLYLVLLDNKRPRDCIWEQEWSVWLVKNGGLLPNDKKGE